MSSELTCRSELSEFVTYHVLGDIYGYELVTVGDGNRVTDEIGANP